MARRSFALKRLQKDRAVIIEVFFDGDRNEDLEPQKITDKRWRVLVWSTSIGNKEIDPDSEYYDAFPNSNMNSIEAKSKAADLGRKLAESKDVYFCPVVPARKVLDLDEKKSQPAVHLYRGRSEELWEPNSDCNLGPFQNYEDEATTP